MIEMSKLGYGVKWVDSYKYITYTTPDGQRFRDNRLPENKYLKSNMEVLFNYGYERFKTTESDRSRDERNGEIIDRTDTFVDTVELENLMKEEKLWAKKPLKPKK